MDKKDLIEGIVFENENVSKAQAGRIVDAITDMMVEAISDGEEVKLGTFCRLSPYIRSARTARNPQTGETIQCPAKRSVRFKPLKQLKEALA